MRSAKNLGWQVFGFLQEVATVRELWALSWNTLWLVNRRQTDELIKLRVLLRRRELARRSLRNLVFSFADRVHDHGYQLTLGWQGWARSVRAHEAQPAQGRSVAIRLPNHASSQRQKLQVRYGRKVFYGCSAWRRRARENNWLHETLDGIVARTRVVKELPLKTNIEDLNKMAGKVLGTTGGCDRGSLCTSSQQ